MLTFQRVAVLSALAAIIGACSGSAPTQTSPAVGLAAAEPATADVVGSSSEALAGTGSCPWGPGECLWPADGVPNFQGGLYVEEAKDTKTEVRVRFPLRGEGVPSSFVLQAQLPSDSGDGTGKLRVELLSDAETPVVLATGSINLAAICAGGDANCATATGNRVLVALQALPTLKPLNAGDFLNLRIFTELTGLRRINLGVVSRAVAATAFVGGSTKRVTIPRKGRTATDTFVTSTLAFIPGVEWTAPPSCQNGLRDVVANDAAQTETDIDCGGPCDPCATGRRCLTSAGCADGLVCRSLKTGVETVGACDPALDTCTCGARFKAGGLCRANELEGEPNRASGRECVSGLCTEGADSIRRCTNPPPATCSNGKVDPKSESGPDCGGTVCAARCGTGVACKVPSDCGASMTCVAGKCNTPLSAAAAAPCTLGTECDSGLCGGSPPVCLAQGTLEPGASCVLAGQCTSGGCTIPRGKTTGTCRQLPKGKDSACTSGADCQSGLCGGTPMLCRAKASLYPGDVCVMNAQCISGSCKNLDGKASTCQPAAPGKACTFAKECNVQVKDGQWDDKFSCTSGVCLGNAEALVSSASLCVSKAVTKATIKSKTKVCTPAPDCSDAFLNGNETDIDRGGPKTGEMVCPRVLTDGLCRVDSDCLDGRCSSSGSCLKPTCRDGVQNGSEAAVDCGGACAPCPAGTPGVKPSGAAGCASGVVVCTKATCSPDEADGWRCAPPRCDDGRVNGSETSKVDDGSECGGSCGPCPVNETPYPKCRTGADCSSGVCKGAKSKVLGSCQPATTRDGIRNGDESDVDCGGTQANVVKCALGRRCSFATDCVTGTTCIGADGNAAGDQPAVGGVCSAATCDDLLATPNGGETDVNCGGPNCGIRCDENQKCKVDSDCLSGGCKKSDKTCLGSSTVDNVRNGTETDIDCGCREAARGSDGTCPDPFARCSLGAACESDDDCVSNACLGGVCSLRACKASTAPAFNAALHRECGRGCANRCATGKACEADVDCASYNCYENVCRERTSSGCTAGFVKSALTGMCEDLEAPPDPADFTYEGDVGQTRVQLTWSRVEAPDGSPVIGYVLAAAADAETVSCDAASKTKEVADAGKDGQGSGVLDNLEPDTDYVITVCAKDQRRNVSKGSIKSIRVRTKPCHAIDHCPSAALSCTNESDQKCRACEAGYYISSAVEEPDTCVACPTGYWCPAPETPGTSGITASDVTADNTLYQWTKCGTDVPGTAQSTPGTTTSNRTCVACEAGYVPNVLSSGNAEECHDIAAPNDAVVLTTPSRSSIRLDWSTPQNPDGSALHHYLVAFHRSGS
ncbi:MAG: hypothetical protein RL199_1305, partial [Pseudomonadota bacterium]